MQTIDELVRQAKAAARAAIGSDSRAEASAAYVLCSRARTACALRVHLPGMREDVRVLDALIARLHDVGR